MSHAIHISKNLLKESSKGGSPLQTHVFLTVLALLTPPLRKRGGGGVGLG